MDHWNGWPRFFAILPGTKIEVITSQVAHKPRKITTNRGCPVARVFCWLYNEGDTTFIQASDLAKGLFLFKEEYD
jgi:hypothetical protein